MNKLLTIGSVVLALTVGLGAGAYISQQNEEQTIWQLKDQLRDAETSKDLMKGQLDSTRNRIESCTKYVTAASDFRVAQGRLVGSGEALIRDIFDEDKRATYDLASIEYVDLYDLGSAALDELVEVCSHNIED